jgi:hypothetical protein
VSPAWIIFLSHNNAGKFLEYYDFRLGSCQRVGSLGYIAGDQAIYREQQQFFEIIDQSRLIL